MIGWQPANTIPRRDCWVICWGDVIGADGSTVRESQYLGRSVFRAGRFGIEQLLTTSGHALRVTHWCQITRPDGQAWRMTDLAAL